MFNDIMAPRDYSYVVPLLLIVCMTIIVISLLLLLMKPKPGDRFVQVLENIVIFFCPPGVLHGVDEDFFAKYRCAQVIDTQIRQFRNNQRLCFVTLRVGLEGNDEDQTTVFAISETTQFILDLDKLKVGDNVLLYRAIGADDQPRIVRDTEGGG